MMMMGGASMWCRVMMMMGGASMWCREMMMMIKASFNKQQRKEYRIRLFLSLGKLELETSRCFRNF
jgi:hypothetical protein